MATHQIGLPISNYHLNGFSLIFKNGGIISEYPMWVNMLELRKVNKIQFFTKGISTFLIKESMVVSSVMTFHFIRYLNFTGPWLLILLIDISLICQAIFI